jgi:Mn2+/Fe2+ NRAMP family transporter
VVQLNIWNAVAAYRLKAPELANRILPGSGYLLAVLVVVGGLVFNMGNVAGTGLALQAMAGIDPVTGAMASGLVAMIVFLVKEFGKAMDGFAKWLGLLMIAMVLVVAISTAPPMAEVVTKTFLPETIDLLAVLTLVGGTVGGYISFAGAHRMLDASGSRPPESNQVMRGAISGILISGVMRTCLFLAAFGVIATGFVPNDQNPAASIFKAALGISGEKIFGLVLWCAAITSVIGASYTSVSFLEGWHPFIGRYRQWFIVGFILVSSLLFALFGRPVKILVAAGAINGLILPVSLLIIMLALGKGKRPAGFPYPAWLWWAGWLVTILVVYLAWMAIKPLMAGF